MTLVVEVFFFVAVSGSAKLLDGGLAWMNGATMQTIVLTDYVRFGMPAGLWLLESFWLCVAAAVMTLAWRSFSLSPCSCQRLGFTC